MLTSKSFKTTPIEMSRLEDRGSFVHIPFKNGIIINCKKIKNCKYFKVELWDYS